MALIHFRWYSQVLNKQVETQILLPEHLPERCATFYLLHGLSDDSTMWLRRTRIETDVAGLPLIVVMPDGFRGFYADTVDGAPYGKYIGQELVDVIDRVFPTIATREKRSIGGLSMGGYGALRTALTYPDRFVSANSHSGALAAGHSDGTPSADGNRDKLMESLFGQAPRGGRNDLVALATQAHAAGKLPKLLIDCGRHDFLHDDNIEITNKFRELGIPHEFREFAGIHDWNYWNEHVSEAVAFHCQAMNVRRPAK